VLNLDGRFAGLEMHNTSTSHQLERADLIQLRRPTHRDLERPPREQHVVRCEQDPRATDVDGFALSRPIAFLIPYTIADFALDGESA